LSLLIDAGKRFVLPLTAFLMCGLIVAGSDNQDSTGSVDFFEDAAARAFRSRAPRRR
jgi:hypothetical protein